MTRTLHLKICPTCGFTLAKKNGHIHNRQRYMCKYCSRQFNDSTEGVLTRASTEYLQARKRLEAQRPKSGETRGVGRSS